MVVIKNGTKTEELLFRDSGMWNSRMKFFSSNRELSGKKLSKKMWRNRAKANIPQRYISYIYSDSWKRRKFTYFKKHKRACIICKATERVHLHHIVYGERGSEKDKHLTPVCEMHHNDFHEKFGSKGNMTAEWQEYLNDCKS